ncbi:MAG: poly(R)-hydroxyalkanoic acid synthase subunit PhaE [Bacteroidota bacterium]
MANQSNPFEQFVDTQNKIFDAWTTTSKQMVESFAPQEGTEKSKEIFDAWWNDQRKIVQEIINPGSPEDAIKNAPNQMQKWMESQMKFMEKLTDFYKSMAKDAGQSTMIPAFAKENYTKWQDFMVGNAKTMAEALKGHVPAGVTAQMESWTKTYTDMFAQWDSITDMIQNGAKNAQMMGGWNSPFSMEAYQKMTNQMMGMNPADQMKKSADFFDQYFKQAVSNFQSFGDTSNSTFESMQASLKQLPMMPNFTFFDNVNSAMQTALDKSFAPLSNFNHKGDSAEVIQIMKEVPKAYSNFVVKSAEMQNHVYQGAQKALPMTVEHFTEAYEKDKSLPSYDEFFKAWVAKMEAEITKVFESKEYAKLQNEVNKSSMTIRQQMDKMTELAFANTPFTTRSEADDLAKELAALRKKVRELERKLEAAPTPEVTAPVKKTTRRTAAKK